MEAGAPLPLLVWLSPAFPVGAFAYSHALEWAHESGQVGDDVDLEAWLDDLLSHGSPRNDAILLAAAYRSVMAGDEAALAEVTELALALASSRERHLEAATQGAAFLAACRKAWPAPALDAMAERHGEITHAVAVGAAAAAHAQPLRPTLEAFLLAFAANLVSAALRLGIIGQTAGQRVTAALLPRIVEVAAAAGTSTLDDLGGAAFRSDIGALRHETQYTRLFRS